TKWLYGVPYAVPEAMHAGVTVVAVNVGGALIPTLLSLYLFFQLPLRGRMVIGTAVVAVVVYQLAHIVPGVGIVVPILVPPLLAAGVALILAYHRAPPVAYASGTKETLLGADVFDPGKVDHMAARIGSIGEAGPVHAWVLMG